MRRRKVTGEITVGEALSRFRNANGLSHQEHAARCWMVKAGPAAFTLPNFGWRRRAIDAHDVHHMLTGYPCTVFGEMQIAAWELGAGRYPHWGATLFCLPLALAGFLWAPASTLAAFRRGCRERSLYDDAIIDGLVDLPLDEARRLIGDGPGTEAAPAAC